MKQYTNFLINWREDSKTIFNKKKKLGMERKILEKQPDLEHCMNAL